MINKTCGLVRNQNMILSLLKFHTCWCVWDVPPAYDLCTSLMGAPLPSISLCFLQILTQNHTYPLSIIQSEDANRKSLISWAADRSNHIWWMRARFLCGWSRMYGSLTARCCLRAACIRLGPVFVWTRGWRQIKRPPPASGCKVFFYGERDTRRSCVVPLFICVLWAASFGSSAIRGTVSV